jgi:hypothetical protein
MKTWLAETRQLDLSHPKLRITALKLTQSHQTLAARSAAIFDYVRRLPFAAVSHGAQLRASDVLLRGAGDSHAKGLLFVALCRAAGLPARMRFMRVRARFLEGMVDSRPEAITHAVGEVYVDGTWRATDGYVLDPVMFVHAKRSLRASGMDSGWGIVCDAQGRWDGLSDSTHQFRAEDVIEDYGAFADIAAFRRQHPRRHHGVSAWLRSTVSTCLLNWRVARLRTRTFAMLQPLAQ